MSQKRRILLHRAVNLLLIMVIIALVFCLVSLRSGIVSYEYALSSLEKKKAELSRTMKSLQAEKARLLSVERFESLASHGFVFPDRVRVVWVSNGEPKDAMTASYRVSGNPAAVKTAYPAN